MADKIIPLYVTLDDDQAWDFATLLHRLNNVDVLARFQWHGQGETQVTLARRAAVLTAFQIQLARQGYAVRDEQCIG